MCSTLLFHGPTVPINASTKSDHHLTCSLFFFSSFPPTATATATAGYPLIISVSPSRFLFLVLSSRHHHRRSLYVLIDLHPNQNERFPVIHTVRSLASALQTNDGAELWKKMLSSREKSYLISYRWGECDFQPSSLFAN
jgi:hypothetical protein